jgi:23S rRNA pseudouridine2605 synthase
VVERIAKVMARAGLCSRRDAERWIAEGRVFVNGKRLDSPAFTVSDTDVIAVDGKPIPAKEPTRLLRYNKPRPHRGRARDPGPAHGVRQPAAGLPRVVSIGRSTSVRKDCCCSPTTVS